MAETWGTQPTDFLGEPRKVFINFLIWNLKEIETQLFFGGRASQAVSRLRGLISVLDVKSQQQLEPQLKKLLEFDGGKPYYKTDVEIIFREVTAYLHETYLKELRLPRLEKKDFDEMEEEEP